MVTIWNWNRLWILSLVLLFLTACPEPDMPSEISLTLDMSEAAPGSPVTATLAGLNGQGSSVTVAGASASILSTSDTTVRFAVPALPPEQFGEQPVIVTNGSASVEGVLEIVEGAFRLDRTRAERGEIVTATVQGISLEGASLEVANEPVDILVVDDMSFRFTLPNNLETDLQLVTLMPASGDPYTAGISILGDVVQDKVTLLVSADTSESDLRQQLASFGFQLEGSLESLGGGSATCSGELANIDVGGTPLGEALSILEELEQNGQGITLYVDPRSGWSIGSVDHLGATGAPLAQVRGLDGAGTLIAVLDTGVNPHSELGSRFRTDLSYDFIANDATPGDSFDDPSSPGAPFEGHGTPIAILAAGSSSGVAPAAEVMGVKVCDNDGCPSSKVIQGVCHVLANAPDPARTVINLSLGGDTPVLALEAILREALDQGVLVAVAAGNQGEADSPTHYPAAHILEGLVAVGALESQASTCLDFEDLALGSRYELDTSFTTSGVDIDVAPFYFVAGQPSSSGAAEIVAGFAGGQAVTTQEVNLAPAFDYPLDGLTLRYEELGSTVNLELNGVRLIVDGMDALDGETSIPGVSVVVTADARGSDAGTLTLTGTIQSFAIGGLSEEFFIDDVCPIKPASWQPAPFSTRGTYVDIAAPGSGIRSGTPDGGYFSFEGTSFATPQVAGALALWRQAEPDTSPAEIEAKLKAAALSLPFSAEAVGAGLLDLSTSP